MWVAVAEETEYIGYIGEDSTDIVDDLAIFIDGTFNEDIARVKDLLFEHLFAVALLIDFLDGNNNLTDEVLNATTDYLSFDIFLSLFLFATDGSENVPLLLDGHWSEMDCNRESDEKINRAHYRDL